MVRDSSTGAVVFRCPCGVEQPGGPGDARISGGIIGGSNTTIMYSRLIQTAPEDRTVQLVGLPCPDCGLDYAAQIRVGESEEIIYRCKCGREVLGGSTV
jgi:hypothetical protein